MHAQAYVCINMYMHAHTSTCVCISVSMCMVVCDNMCIGMHKHVSVCVFHQSLSANCVLPAMYKWESYIGISLLPPPFPFIILREFC